MSSINGNLEDARSKIESLVVYLAKQRHFASTKLDQADRALTDATSVLVAIETEIEHPLVYVPPADDQIGQSKSDTPIGDLTIAFPSVSSGTVVDLDNQ